MPTHDHVAYDLNYLETKILGVSVQYFKYTDNKSHQLNTVTFSRRGNGLVDQIVSGTIKKHLIWFTAAFMPVCSCPNKRALFAGNPVVHIKYAKTVYFGTASGPCKYYDLHSHY